MDLLACLWAPSSHLILNFSLSPVLPGQTHCPLVPNAHEVYCRRCHGGTWPDSLVPSCTLEAVYPMKAANTSCHRHPGPSSALFSSRQPGCFCPPDYSIQVQAVLRPPTASQLNRNRSCVCLFITACWPHSLISSAAILIFCHCLSSRIFEKMKQHIIFSDSSLKRETRILGSLWD